MPNNSATHALSQQWRKHIEAWRKSGLSQQAFCRDQGLSYHKFHYWRNKLIQTPVKKTATRSSALVPVTYPGSTANNGLSIHFPNGTRLQGIGADNLSEWDQQEFKIYAGESSESDISLLGTLSRYLWAIKKEELRLDVLKVLDNNNQQTPFRQWTEALLIEKAKIAPHHFDPPTLYSLLA